MKSQKFLLPTLTAWAILLSAAGSVWAQRARTISGEPQKQTGTQSVQTTVPAAPPTIKAKYEGGVIGYPKSDGSLNFDDENRRLVFRDKTGKEIFSIPFDAVAVAYADTKARQPTAAKVIGSLPLPYGANIPAWFVKKKYRYLTLQYKDTDTQAEGLTSFKLDDEKMLASVVTTLANKARLTQRGEAYIRRRDQGSTARPPAGDPATP